MTADIGQDIEEFQMMSDFVPVCRPLLPSADSIAHYIRQIDACRYYTNRGPLVGLLEERIAALIGQEEHVVRTAASGTSAIEVAILASAGQAGSPTNGQAGPARPIALLPSFTFAATALAVERCGYRPCFVDIDPQTWTIDLAALRRHPLIGQAGVIVAVAPYGVLPDMRALEDLQTETGVQIVVDAAAAFEQITDNPGQLSAMIPITVSFHATKTFSTGEGGAVFWRNPEGQDRIVQVSNFGFNNGRQALTAGINSKLSEYHAAVGLAMLDGFPARRLAYAKVARFYRQHAAGRDLGGRLHLPPDVSSAYVLFEAADAAGMLRAEDSLHASSIETRRWYEAGVHVQPHFREPDLGQPSFGQRDDSVNQSLRHSARALAVTTDLSGRLLGLPMAADLSEADIARVVDTLCAAAAAQHRAAEAKSA